MKPLYLLFCVLGSFLLSEFAAANTYEQKISISDKNQRQLEQRDIYEAEKEFKCPFPFGAFSDPDDCDYYFVCVGGVSFHRKCKTFYQFDTLRKVCLPILVAICDDSGKGKTSTTTVSTTTTSGDSFSCPNFMGTYPHPEDCSKYYTCMMYKATLKTCPAKQLFDAVKKSCKAADQVNCGSRERPGSTTVTVTESATYSTSTETDPETVSTTIEDITSTDDRPTGPPETDCEKEDVDCIIDETGDPDDWFKCPEDVGSYVHPSSNRLFIFCMNWKPSVKRCGMDLVFSKELATCIEVKYLL